MKVLVNGEFVDENEAVLPITNKAVWFDFGVYESIKFLQKNAFYPERHVARFFHSASLISLELGYTQQDILAWIQKILSQSINENGLIRMCAYGDTEQNMKANIYLFVLGLTFYPNTFYSQGVKAVTYPGERFLPQSKTMNTLLNFLAFRKAKQEDALDAILINKDGFATEGTRSNLFIIKHQQVITPPEEIILNGVTRQLTCEWAKEQNIPIEEEKITQKQLLQADEVFITSTGMNIMPIVKINDAVIHDGSVGTLTKQLSAIFRQKQREYFNQT